VPARQFLLAFQVRQALFHFRESFLDVVCFYKTNFATAYRTTRTHANKRRQALMCMLAAYLLPSDTSGVIPVAAHLLLAF
jgi:hypothetical protein